MDGCLNRAAASPAHGPRRPLAQLDPACAERLAALRSGGGFLPVCSWCRRFRDESGRWVQADCGDPEAA